MTDNEPSQAEALHYALYPGDRPKTEDDTE